MHFKECVIPYMEGQTSCREPPRTSVINGQVYRAHKVCSQLWLFNAQTDMYNKVIWYTESCRVVNPNGRSPRQRLYPYSICFLNVCLVCHNQMSSATMDKWTGLFESMFLQTHVYWMYFSYLDGYSNLSKHLTQFFFKTLHNHIL